MSEETVTAEEKCPVCDEPAHPHGSVAYRDCRAAQLDAVLEDPDKWSFAPSDLEREIVTRAYRVSVELLDGKGPPEVQTVMNAVTLACRERGHDAEGSPELDPVAFWAGFQHDMPELLAERVKMHGHDIVRKPSDPIPELELIWQSYKVKGTLGLLGLPYQDYETRAVEMHLGGDVTHEFLIGCRAALDELAACLSLGFAVYDKSVTTLGVTWFWRKTLPVMTAPTENPAPSVGEDARP